MKKESKVSEVTGEPGMIGKKLKRRELRLVDVMVKVPGRNELLKEINMQINLNQLKEAPKDLK